MVKALSFPLCFLLMSSGLLAQQKNLETYFAQVRSGKHPNVPLDLTKPENATATLNRLPNFLNDSVVIVRGRAAGISRLIGTQSKITANRAKAVQQLVIAAKDKDSGNAGAALTFLSEFKKTDFSTVDKDTLFVLFKRKSAHLNILIRLMGYLEIQSSKSDLFNLSQNSSFARKERWAALLALARMNDEQAAADIIARVKRMPVTDAVVYEVFPDLVYTRRREATEYLIESLNSDSKNCESANSESAERVPCAYRAMEMLAPIIENYPLKLNESGDIETNDYPTALQKVRDWFKVNKDYKILRDKF
ncbi:MAG: hypothetical protein ACKO96_18765 [Flammeovirgaceae bacterium]